MTQTQTTLSHCTGATRNFPALEVVEGSADRKRRADGENLMKAAALVVVAWCWLAVQAGAADGGKPPVRLAVELTDGSRVVGVTQQESISIQNEIGKLQVALRLVDQVRWKADREHVVVEMANGDRITGAIIPETIPLETLFGQVRIPMQHVVLLKTMPLPMAGFATLEGLILYAPFDEPPEAGKVTSRIGELQGTNQGGQWVREGQRGGAFQFTAYDQAILVPDQEALRPKHLTVSVWVKPKQAFANSSYRGIVAKTTSGSWTGGFGLASYPGSPDIYFFVNNYLTDSRTLPFPRTPGRTWPARTMAARSRCTSTASWRPRPDRKAAIAGRFSMSMRR